jgi:hypothetical protein
MKPVRKPMLTAMTVFVLLGALGFVQAPDTPAQGKEVFALQAPAFVSVAHAAEEAVLSVIGDEAGIAAYFQAATAPNMDAVLAAFRTIEQKTDDYIVGSVSVLNYPESEDVHVYVDRDGWILAYYLAADPAAKIFDWRAYRASAETDLTTKLENTLARVATYAVVPYSGCTYYDFRHPSATDLTLVAEWTYHGIDSFQFKLPGQFTYLEGSWSAGGTWSVNYVLDGVSLFSQNPQTWLTTQGYLESHQMLLEVFHTVNVDGYQYGYGGLALVYRVP